MQVTSTSRSIPVRGATTADAQMLAPVVGIARDLLARSPGATPSNIGHVVLDQKLPQGVYGQAFLGTGPAGSWLGMSPTATESLLRGVRELTSGRSYEEWSQAERSAFVAVNDALLHELGHITRARYQDNNLELQVGPLEEGLVSVAARSVLPEFMRAAYQVEVDAMTLAIRDASSGYRMYESTLQRLFGLTGALDDASVGRLAERLAFAVPAERRLGELASAIAQAGGSEQLTDGAAPELAGLLDMELAFPSEGYNRDLEQSVTALHGRVAVP